jgi:thiol-disulfide isomerase/thioredoxin
MFKHNKPLKFLFPLLFLISIGFCNAQLKISYIYNGSNLDSNFYFDIIKPVNQKLVGPPPFFKISIINFQTHDFTYKTNCEFLIPDTTIAFFADGFGHPSILIPNDTLSIRLKKKIKSNGLYMLNGKFLSTWFYDFAYTGKNKFVYSILDSLSYYTGSLYMPSTNLEKSNNDLSVFFRNVQDVYNKRLEFLNRYSTEHYIPANILKLVHSEIWSANISNLLQPLSNINTDFKPEDYPKSYLDMLANLNFNDSVSFFHTINYASTALSYYSLYWKKFLQNSKSIYTEINEKITNKDQCEYMLANYLLRMLNDNEFNNDYTLFKERFPKGSYIAVLDSLYNIKTERVKININQAMSSVIVDLNNRKSDISALCKRKPVVIDCWASWCNPCIYQFPFMKIIENKYYRDIDFINLSFDRTQEEWEKGVEKLKIEGQNYFLENNFKSDFAKYFSIGSIPRFIIIGKDGKVVSDNAPRPSRKEKLEIYLDSLINRTK